MDRQRVRHLVTRRFAPAAGLIGLGALLANLAAVGVVVERTYNYITNVPNTGTIQVNVYDGTRNPIPATSEVLLTVIDGNQKEVFRKYVKGQSLKVTELQFHDNFGDLYTVLVWKKGFKQAGFHPVKLKRGQTVTIDLMLMPDPYKLNFDRAAWETIKTTLPAFHKLMSQGLSDADARARYEKLMADKPLVLAHLLNVAAAINVLTVGSGETILPFYKELVFDETMKQNKFFVYVDRSLVAKMRAAVAAKTWEYAAGASVFHKGNTASFKEVSFWEANVQITFYETDSKVIDGVDVVRVDTDIDYYRDPASHIILEVIPNTAGGGMTNPLECYQLRWIASHAKSGAPVFDPPYVVEPKQ